MGSSSFSHLNMQIKNFEAQKQRQKRKRLRRGERKIEKVETEGDRERGTEG